MIQRTRDLGPNGLRWSSLQCLFVTEAPHNIELFTRVWGRNILVSLKADYQSGDKTNARIPQ